MTEEAKPDWRIYYADGTTFDSLQGAPQDAPGQGVIIILQAYWRTGRRVLNMADWYVFEFNRWHETDTFGVLHRHAMGRHPQAAVHGQYVPEDDCNVIFERAFADPDFPRRRPGPDEQYNWNPDRLPEQPSPRPCVHRVPPSTDKLEI